MSASIKTAKVYSSFVEGVEATVSEIEISITPGIPTFDIIGLCDSSIRESEGRIRSSMVSSGFSMPKGHITVAISPAYIKKSGTSFDLAIAAGILFASAQLHIPEGRIYLEGELSLSGKIRSTPASALRLCSTKEEGFDFVIIPEGSVKAAECAGIAAMTAGSLGDLRDIFIYGRYEPTLYQMDSFMGTSESLVDISELKGQQKAKRALIIAASGCHTLLLLGSPGCGKTMAGRIISGILPEPDREEAAEIFAVNEILEKDYVPDVITRPYRYIDQNSTPGSLVGNSRLLTPGELALANHGVLFADEITEFPRGTLEMLRQPLEMRSVTVYGKGRKHIFPANYIFVAAGNPCKCGYAFEGKKCRCSPSSKRKYLSRLSGPFLDRMDLICEMVTVEGAAKQEILKEPGGSSEESFEAMRMVLTARQAQRERYKDMGKYVFNSNVQGTGYADLWRIPTSVFKHLGDMSDKGFVSARGYLGIARVARTIADIEGRMDIEEKDIDEAVLFRRLEGCI